MKPLPIAVPLITLALLAGCTPSSDDTAPETAAPDADTAAETVAPAEEDPPVTEGGDVERATPVPDSCDITDIDIANLNRDWGRVAAGVGRPDWHEYTEPLVETMTALAERAEECPGADHAAALVPLIDAINGDAQNETIDMDVINEFQQVGEDWLEELGYGPNALSTG